MFIHSTTSRSSTTCMQIPLYRVNLTKLLHDPVHLGQLRLSEIKTGIHKHSVLQPYSLPDQFLLYHSHFSESLLLQLLNLFVYFYIYSTPVTRFYILVVRLTLTFPHIHPLPFIINFFFFY